MESLQRLQDLFRELFQLDLADLDFGLYRLFHLKRAEIEAFITEQLPREVDAAFAEASAEEAGKLQEELEALSQQIREQIAEDAILPTGEIKPDYLQSNIRVVRELAAQYEATRQQVQALQITEGHKAEVFNHLVNFFSRYYEDGDFIPKRRYGARETYAVPYNGEEVFFHWANRDQHYVKTAERFKDYAFKLRDLTGEYRVRFTMTEASIPKDNTKGNTRYFFPRPDLATYDADAREFVLPFEYRLPTPEEAEQYGKNSKAQEAILEQALPGILDAVPDDNLRALLNQPVDAGEEAPTVLLKRLRHFCRRNTSDYFIHKDLRGFLTRELEFYIKDQVIHLMDLEADLDAKRRVVRTFRRLAENVIDFLATIEDAQKTLFEKKKFVLETDYLIPIQHVPREFWPEILQNEGQLAEWRAWLALEPERDLFNPEGEVNEAFLESHPTLPVHTKHFDRDFVRRLLEALPFEDLDEATDGLLVHGENYQALKLLLERYREQVKCIYIDPPYNTSENTFLYKNRYKHSSWVAMIATRLAVAYHLLSPEGVLACAIDDTEKHHLRIILQDLFGEQNYVACIAAEVNPAGQNLRPNAPALSHDYCLVFARDIDQMKMLLRRLTEEEKARYTEKDEKGYYLWDNLRRRGGNSRPSDRPGQWFPLYADLRTRRVSVEPFEGSQEIWPIDPRGEKRIWRVNLDGARREIAAGEISVIEKAGRLEIVKKTRMPEGKKPKTLWKDPRYSTTTYGTKLLIDILGEQSFSYPKSVHLVEDCVRHWAGPEDVVFDFFAGSGTTAHAVIRLNRADDGARKFILVEMAEYFDTVLLPRIAKVMYTPEWKDGKPEREATPEEAERSPRLVKILRIESYEDTLHNLVAPSTLERAAEYEAAYKALLGEDAYRLRYWIELPLREAETCLRALDLAHPFSYTLEILTDEGPIRKPVDLVETFNYLYGLRVKRYETWRNPDDGDREYRVVKAADREGKRRILVLWRDMADHDPEAERAFLEAKIAEMEANGEVWDEVLINGDSPTPGVASLDPLFKRLMMVGEGKQ